MIHKKTQLWILVFATLITTVAAGRAQPIAEGYLVAGVAGRVAKGTDKNQWEFFPAEDITDGKHVIAAETGVSLLASSTLEQIIRLADDSASVEVRLWAMVTEYRGQNALYGLYFLPIKAAPPEAPPRPVRPEQTDSKDKDSVLPDEILHMMQRNGAPDLKRLDEIKIVTTDRNLIHRTGLLQADEDGFIFLPDAFGQNVKRVDYRLLPNKTLESVGRQIQRSPGRRRYVVSGVITEFEGQTFLLVRRAVRTYTHGNFTP